MTQLRLHKRPRQRPWIPDQVGDDSPAVGLRYANPTCLDLIG